jgi:hypothetical protein
MNLQLVATYQCSLVHFHDCTWGGGGHFFIVAVVCWVYGALCSHRHVVLLSGIHMLLPILRFGDSVTAVGKCVEGCPIPDELSHCCMPSLIRRKFHYKSVYLVGLQFSNFRFNCWQSWKSTILELLWLTFWTLPIVLFLFRTTFRRLDSASVLRWKSYLFGSNL